jgi:hypothetical protein
VIENECEYRDAAQRPTDEKQRMAHHKAELQKTDLAPDEARRSKQRYPTPFPISSMSNASESKSSSSHLVTLP